MYAMGVVFPEPATASTLPWKPLNYLLLLVGQFCKHHLTNERLIVLAFYIISKSRDAGRVPVRVPVYSQDCQLTIEILV